MLFHSYSITKITTLLLFITLFFTQGNSELFKREKISKGEESKEMIMKNSMIGSRPPQCEKRCLDCVHCEAIQVPATPQERRRGEVRESTMSTNSRDGGSNYKPLDWKCKCGNFIFNP